MSATGLGHVINFSASPSPHLAPRACLLTSMSEMSVPSTIATFDSRITALEDLASNRAGLTSSRDLIALKRERNALTPLCTSPDEIIVRILANLTNVPHLSESFFHTELSSPSRTWLVALSVCFRLRNVSNNSPELWSFVDCSAKHEWVKTCIERAGAHPLRAYALTNSKTSIPYTNTKELVTSILQRAKLAEIRFAFEDNQMGSDSVLQFLLDLTFPSLPEGLEYLRAFCISVLPPSTIFLDGKCENLVELALYNFTFPHHPACPRLRRLKLEMLHQSDGDYILVLDWLRSLPLLEILMLGRIGATGSRTYGVNHEARLEKWATSGHSSAKISMPYLRVLWIKEALSTIWLLLEILPTPSHSLSLHINHEYHQNLHLPPHHESTGLQEIVFAYAKRFWNERTGHDFMPPTRLIVLEKPMRIQIGTQPSAVNTAPSLFYETNCELHDVDPILSTVDTVSVALWSTRDENQYREWEDTIPVELGSTLELVDQLMLREDSSLVLETLRLCFRDSKRHLDAEAWAVGLQQAGLVGQVIVSR
jgi:hypothetical protein